MLRNIYTKGYLILIILLCSCSEKYNFEFDNNDSILVVDGKITNQDGPYYVRLSESINKTVSPDYSGTQADVAKAIENAKISISNSKGETENLRYIGKKPHTYPEDDGWYIIENMQGEIGQTYTLRIEWKDKIYTAKDKIHPVAEIEKIEFRTKHLAAKNEYVDIPLIYFKDPQGEKNYYLMYFSSDGFFGSNRNWEYSILDDKYLEPYVDGLDVDDGQSPTGEDFYMNINDGMTVSVYLESLSPEAYNFYKSIIDQFTADGGAFSPTPANPPSNISGGALGCFRASAVSVFTRVK